MVLNNAKKDAFVCCWHEPAVPYSTMQQSFMDISVRCIVLRHRGGQITEERIDESVVRILNQKAELGLLENLY